MRDLNALRKKVAALWPHLDERARRLFAAGEARALGRGGVTLMSRVCGLSRVTITKGLRELDEEPRIFETRDDGEVSVWGTVTEIQPPDFLCFTWHPGRQPGTAQRVAVRFTAEGEGTRLVLTHSGWERLGDEAAKTRDGYVQGWDYVLGGYAGGSNA